MGKITMTVETTTLPSGTHVSLWLKYQGTNPIIDWGDGTMEIEPGVALPSNEAMSQWSIGQQNDRAENMVYGIYIDKDETGAGYPWYEYQHDYCSVNTLHTIRIDSTEDGEVIGLKRKPGKGVAIRDIVFSPCNHLKLLSLLNRNDSITLCTDKLTELKWLYVHNILNEELDFCHSNLLRFIYVSHCPNLRRIDLRRCPYVSDINCPSNPLLTHIDFHRDQRANIRWTGSPIDESTEMNIILSLRVL